MTWALLETFYSSPTSSAYEVLLTEAVAEANVELPRFFTRTHSEVLKYAVEVPPSFSKTTSVNADTGLLTIKARGGKNAEYVIKAYALNQYKKRSPPLNIQVTEEYVNPPKIVTPLPKEIILTPKEPSKTIYLSRHIQDPQKRLVRFSVSGAPDDAVTFDEPTLVFNSLQKSHAYTLEIVASNGRKEFKTTLPVTEVYTHPPVLISPLPSDLKVSSSSPLTIDCKTYFSDHPSNHKQTLAFSVATNPQSAMNIVNLSSGIVTIRSRNESYRFEIKITATNAYGLTVSTNAMIEDVGK